MLWIKSFHRTTMPFWGMILAMAAAGHTSAVAKVDTTDFGKKIVAENLPKTILDEYRKFDEGRPRTFNSASIRGWTHDGKRLLLSRSGNLYSKARKNDKYRLVLDLKKENVGSGRKIDMCGKDGYVFLHDKDGDEYFELLVADGSTFAGTKISAGKATNRLIEISDDKKQIAYSSAPENSGIWNLIARDPCPQGNSKTLYTGPAPLYSYDFSPDGRKLLTGGYFNNGEELREYDLESGEYSLILKTKDRIFDAAYSSDGRKIFLASNSGREFVELLELDVQAKSLNTLIGGVGMDIDDLVISDDRSKMAILFNRLGLTSIAVIDLEAKKLLSAPSRTSLGVVTSAYFSPDGNKLAVNFSQPTIPSRAGIFDYRKDKLELWSGGYRRGEKAITLVPDIVFYPSPKKIAGKEAKIPLLAYKPSTASKSKKAPVVIFAHGGPASQSQPSYSSFYRHIVENMGIAVLRPNIRGSTGYGKSFEKADQIFKRPDAIADIGALLDWIKAQPDLDEERVVIAGGSYGGFVVLASLIAYPDRFAGGISSVGVTDFHTFMKNTEAYRVDNRRREYGDERNADVAKFFKSISPLENAGEIKVPVLILQGANDPRVPQQQADDMVAAIRKNGVPVSYLLAKNEGHGFKKAKNKRLSTGARLHFLRKILLEK